MLAKFVLVGVVLVGCSKRNDSVCCLTAADCESIGLSATDVGNRGCRDGESCIDLTCVPTPTPDAANPDARPDSAPGPDAPYSGRCDPSKPFSTITNLPNLHVAYGEHHFVLSSDELTAYILRDNQDVNVVTTSIRASKSDDFPVDSADPLIGPGGSAIELFPSRQEHLLYVHRRVVPQYALAERTTTTDEFVTQGGIGINDTGDPFPGNSILAGVSSDATRLYYTNGGSLYQLTSSGSFSLFGAPLIVSSMMVDAVALSPDELTLYYATNPATGVFVTTRADLNSVFGPGTQVSLLATDDAPAAITADVCILYVIGHEHDTDGVFAVTKPH
jgi:hypothetical protein